MDHERTVATIIRFFLLFLALASFGTAVGPVSAQPLPVGLWEFDDPGDLMHAETGSDLVLIGSHQAVEGVDASDGAARVDAGSYYICDHGIPVNGGGSYVNEYTLVMDVQTYGRGLWHCLYQTNEGNGNDGDAFINPPGRVGLSSTGYSFPRMLDARTWYRLTIVVDNGQRYEIYADGIRILGGTPQSVDGRFSLDPTVLFFADDNGDDGEIDVSRIAVYGQALSSSEVATLGSLGGLNHFVTRPYVQNVKPDGISIMWETEEAETAYVEYGLTTGYGIAGSADAVDSGSQTWIYTAVLTNLDPSTIYHYRVVSGGFATQDRTFVTAPSGDASFSFGVWSDSQGYNGGDYDRDPTEPSKGMFQHMVGAGIDFGMSCGDLAEIGEDYSDTRVFYVDRPVSLLGGQDLPFFNTWGNHDGVSDGAVIRKFADLPSKDRGAPYHAGYGSYSLDYAGCHFVCIDYLCESSDVPGWVEADLQSPEAQNAKFIFLFVHRPPYCERWYNGQQNLRDDLVPLMEQYGVDVCFSGHMHGYNRGFQNGVYYCITGGGSWLDYSEPLVYDWPHMTVGGYHDVAPDIEGGLVHEYVKVDVVGNTFTANMMAFYPDGTFREVLDTFSKAQLPDLTPTSVTIDEDHASAGDSVTVRAVVTNAGDGSSGYFYIHTYLTTEYEWEPDDPNNVHLGGGVYGPLAAAETQTYAIANEVPAGTPTGQYYACAFVDYYDENSESNENNNLGLSDDVVSVSGGSGGGPIEIMTWVPPYAIEECQAAVEADFGECDAKDGLTRVGLQFWIPNWDGTISYQNLGPWGNPTDADVTWWRDWCTANGIQCLLTIYNNDGSTWDWDLARAAFDDNRATFVAALISEMDRLGLDGIDVDLEGIGSLNGDRSAFDQFIHDLWVELEARGRVLTIDSFHYIWNAPNHDWWSDWLGEVDNIHAMGYDDLYEGGTGYHKYSFQQNAGYAAGYTGNVVLMGLPAWLASWGVSSGRGTSAQAHVQEVRYDLAEPTGIAIWDLQLEAWQDSDLWCEIAALKASGSADPPAAPSSLTATAVADSQIDLAWTDNASDEDGFKIERSPGGVSWAQIDTVAADVVNYEDQGLAPETTYHYRVRANNGVGDSEYSNTASATTGPAAGVDGVTPAGCALLQNRPNPFKQATAFTYMLAAECHVEVAVYDTRGRRVATLVDETQASGPKTVTWDAGGCVSGIYFYRLTAGEKVFTRQAVLLK